MQTNVGRSAIGTGRSEGSLLLYFYRFWCHHMYHPLITYLTPNQLTLPHNKLPWCRRCKWIWNQSRNSANSRPCLFCKSQSLARRKINNGLHQKSFHNQTWFIDWRWRGEILPSWFGKGFVACWKSFKQRRWKIVSPS